jgi:hypothetical protein
MDFGRQSSSDKSKISGATPRKRLDLTGCALWLEKETCLYMGQGWWSMDRATEN